MLYNIILIKIKNGKWFKKYVIATAATEHEADKKAKYYSSLYQLKGLYNVLTKPTHIVTYEAIKTI